MRISFEQYFLSLAKLAALRSSCNSRPTGAVIVKDSRVLATGYNGTLSGKTQCKDYGPDYCQRRNRGGNDKGELKYQECPSIHAEQNAINQIARYGGRAIHDLIGADIYCTLFPCVFCMKNIASVGITRVYYELAYTSDDPERDAYWFRTAKEFGLECVELHLSAGTQIQIREMICDKTSKRRLLNVY